MASVRYLLSGDRALTVEFGNEISEKINRLVTQFAGGLEHMHIRGITEVVPAYASVLVLYDPGKVNLNKLLRITAKCIRNCDGGQTAAESEIVEIPVCYGGKYGPDLETLSAELGLTAEEIIRRHSTVIYPIYMMGFLPGFIYLGGMDTSIQAPRLKSPREKIPAGSVGIGGSQTGVYPIESPGGWRLIGRTPVRLYDPAREKPVLLSAGQRVKFVPVDEETFLKYEKEYADDKSKNRKEDDKNADPAVRILNPGPLTTVQDGGRFGYMKAGITECGAMDRRAAAFANLLVGNPENAAVLEATLLGPGMRFLKKLKLAVTGADMQPRLNGMPVPINLAFEVRPGDELTFSFAARGCRSYIAFAGGIDVPEVMGSRSTDLKGKIGGYLGRALRAEDELAVICSGGKQGFFTLKASENKLKRYSEHVPSLSEPGGTIRVRVIPGPQEDHFTVRGCETFFGSSYTVSPASDRMGIRLEGEPVETKQGADIISDGTVFGSVQVPKNGKPIILMADHQTTGGYAKIGTVLYEDLSLLAQARPGDHIIFEKEEVK